MDEIMWRKEITRKKEKHVHITHANHIIDLPNPHPMQHIRHERLEPHVLHARDELRRAEIFVCRVAVAFAEVVDEVPRVGGQY